MSFIKACIASLYLIFRLAFVAVNKKPVLPGHLLVIPKRLVARYKDLTPDEIADIGLVVQKAQAVTEGIKR